MIDNFNQFAPINGVNHLPQTPLRFLKHVLKMYPQHEAVIYGNRQYNWQQFSDRCHALASALIKKGITKGDTVSIIASNTPEMIEAHFGIPLAGAVLNAINVRLDPATLAYILEHSDCQTLITDSFYAPMVKQALAILEKDIDVIDIIDEQFPSDDSECLGGINYEQLLKSGDSDFEGIMPDNEWDPIALNYTSGTSGRPKGVIYHHRGSYLMSLGTIPAWNIPRKARYLYTVPLFHCNGWGHAWTMAAQAGTMVCNREISAEVIFKSILDYKVTHFGAAPIVLSMLSNSDEKLRKDFQQRCEYSVEVMTAGAPPPAEVLKKSQAMGFNVTHVYGLTETYGHAVYCEWKHEWNDLDEDQQAELKSRQGIPFPMVADVDIIDINTGERLPHDGESMGEIIFACDILMKGYYKDSDATEKAFKNGYFHSGDLGVIYPDGYLKIKDRLKDIIISGGENISSVEVESTLYKFPGVSAAAVIALADEKWGEVPHAFVEMVKGQTATAEEIVEFCRNNMARFKCPKKITFCELPKTSTGKIQKFELRKL